MLRSISLQYPNTQDFAVPRSNYLLGRSSIKSVHYIGSFKQLNTGRFSWLRRLMAPTPYCQFQEKNSASNVQFILPDIVGLLGTNLNLLPSCLNWRPEELRTGNVVVMSSQ
jgi:hypothetical protein